jgi:hypothetical protein
MCLGIQNIPIFDGNLRIKRSNVAGFSAVKRRVNLYFKHRAHDIFRLKTYSVVLLSGFPNILDNVACFRTVSRDVYFGCAGGP